MSFEFPRETLGDLIIYQKGFPFKSQDYVDSGVPIVRVSNFTQDSISLEGIKFVDASIEKQNEKVKLREDDIVIATVGSWPNNPASIVGKTVRVPKQLEGALMNQNSVILRTKSGDEIDQKFLFFALKTKAFSDFLVSNAQGSANQASVTLSDIFSYEVEWPTYGIRKSIVAVIDSLSGKIELNQQINQTLEQIAQAIFKSWFVDFEPTRAKIAAKEAGGDQAVIEQAAMCAISGKTPDQLNQSPPETLAQLKATAALFPEALVDSELGEVPEGWFVKQLSELGNVVCGKTPPKDNPEFYGGDIPFIKIPDMHGRMYPTRTTDTLTAAGANTQIKKLLPRDSICVSCIATVGLVSLTCEDSFTNQQINTIVPNSDSYSQYIYFAMLDLNGHLHDLASGGSATLNLNTGHFSKIKIVFPVDEVVDNFSNQVKPMFDLILRQSFEIDLLERVRDSLLPKLLSGELDSLEILEQSI
jgi:type I restriction enzyme S subunit